MSVLFAVTPVQTGVHRCGVDARSVIRYIDVQSPVFEGASNLNQPRSIQPAKTVHDAIFHHRLQYLFQDNGFLKLFAGTDFKAEPVSEPLLLQLEIRSEEHT